LVTQGQLKPVSGNYFGKNLFFRGFPSQEPKHPDQNIFSIKTYFERFSNFLRNTLRI
jgi:hypothetical protein